MENDDNNSDTFSLHDYVDNLTEREGFFEDVFSENYEFLEEQVDYEV